ncbi:MAG: DUF3365 domain-containing protein [Xanthomonadales bacterium]|nr:DUF3365 domain-containing protein [Xanthomonadales bacterium]
MKLSRILLLLLIIILAVDLALTPTPAIGSTEDPRVAQSRELIAAFGSELKYELQKAMGSGGPAAAVKVCRDRSPQIASKLSRKSGASVGRTSLRFRNPGNAPEPWQAEQLRAFDQLAETTPAEQPLEAVQAIDGELRYMRAIRTEPLCLVCHGSAVSPDVARSLRADYPHDRATGYAQGQVRGAFRVVWPAKGSSEDSSAGSSE